MDEFMDSLYRAMKFLAGVFIRSACRLQGHIIIYYPETAYCVTCGSETYVHKN